MVSSYFSQTPSKHLQSHEKVGQMGNLIIDAGAKTITSEDEDISDDPTTPDSDDESFEVPPGLLEPDDSDDASFHSAYSHHEPDNPGVSEKPAREGEFIATLPNELLRKIFNLCLPDSHFIRPISNQMPMVLCQVSKLWRENALDTTTLWSSLSLCRPQHITQFKDFKILDPPLTQLWLQRSRGRSLSLNIGDEPGAEAALPYIDRARDLTLRPSEDFMDEFIRVVRGFKAQGLRLERILINSDSEKVLEKAFNFLGVFPNLRSLDIGQHCVAYPSSAFGWLQRLTRLKLYGGRHDTSPQINILRQCLALEHFEFVGPGEATFQGNIATLSHLRSLTVTGGNCFGNIFSFFKFPALVEISLSGKLCTFGTLDNFGTFEDFCQRSGCTLTSLSADITAASNAEARQIQNLFTTTNTEFVRHITCLNLHLDTEIGLHMEILGLFLALQRLEISIGDRHNADIDVEAESGPSEPLQFTPFPHATFPNLLSLDLVGKGLSDVVFPNFTLPALERLYVSGRLDKPRQFSTFDAFCYRSSFQLQYLSVAVGADCEADLVDILKNSSPLLQLETLEISGGVSDQLMGLLKYPDIGEECVYVLPCLQHLSLDKFTATDGLISRTVSSRWNSAWANAQPIPNSNLRSLIIWGELGAVDQYYIDRLEKDGLSVIRKEKVQKSHFRY